MAEKLQPKFPNTNMLAWQRRVITTATYAVYVHYDNARCFPEVAKIISLKHIKTKVTSQYENGRSSVHRYLR